MINEFEFVYGLLNIKGFGKKKVLEYVDSHCFSLEMCLQYLDFILDESQKTAFEFNVSKAVIIENECKEKKIKVVTLLNEKFPKKLLKGKDPCVLLYYFGNIDLLSEKSIAVIGTRSPEKNFLDKSNPIIKEIVENNYVIVSGLAIGCDAHAHSKCLEYGGKTIAVLPSSVDNIQPKQNLEIAKNIAKSGSLLISEYPPNSEYSKFNYPERDRIQSLLSDKVFVIQASENSGTMICVKKSLQENKNVFALTGNNLFLIKKYIDSSSEDLHELFL